MKHLLEERYAEIRECLELVGGETPQDDSVLEIDKPRLLEILRQAAEIDWDAGYDCGGDGGTHSGVSVADGSANPWRPNGPG